MIYFHDSPGVPVRRLLDSAAELWDKASGRSFEIIRANGRGIAVCFAEHGAKVVVNAAGAKADGSGRDSGPAEEVVKEITERGLTAVPNYDSVTTLEGGESIIRTALDKFGRLGADSSAALR